MQCGQRARAYRSRSHHLTDHLRISATQTPQQLDQGIRRTWQTLPPSRRGFISQHLIRCHSSTILFSSARNRISSSPSPLAASCADTRANKRATRHLSPIFRKHRPACTFRGNPDPAPSASPCPSPPALASFARSAAESSRSRVSELSLTVPLSETRITFSTSGSGFFLPATSHMKARNSDTRAYKHESWHTPGLLIQVSSRAGFVIRVYTHATYHRTI